MFCAELPRSQHVSDLIETYLPKEQKSYVPHIINSWCGRISDNDSTNNNLLISKKINIDDFHKISERGATATANVHLHCFTCHKPRNGYVGCRLCKPTDLIDETKPVELDPKSIDLDIPIVKPTILEGEIEYQHKLKKTR